MVALVVQAQAEKQVQVEQMVALALQVQMAQMEQVDKQVQAALMVHQEHQVLRVHQE
jgi:hypothetical protein